MGSTLSLFQGFGVELEYMIVRRGDLSVLPCSDQILKEVSESFSCEVEMGPLSWCNEVVLHVIEVKTNGPSSTLEALPEEFNRAVGRINGLLERANGCLLPTGMHPWMDPWSETRLWPHEHGAVYHSYDRIFGCRGHGWSNLQSVHLNLPFSGDDQFGRLHAAIRLVLPILPALAASSPIFDGAPGPALDNRLEMYRRNQERIPSITGSVIPEPIFDEQQYREKILDRIYSDIRPFDPDRILQFEWLNSRGAIARFERGAIEIRVLDLQESPLCDLSIAALTIEVLRNLVAEEWSDYPSQKSWAVEPLAEIFEKSVEKGGDGVIDSADYLSMFGCRSRRLSVADLWRQLLERTASRGLDARWYPTLSALVREGCLSKRILVSLQGNYERKNLMRVYRSLADTLATGGFYHVG